MAYDSSRQVTVLFGGYTGVPGAYHSDETWEWNGNAWTRRLIPGPSPRRAVPMTYDAARAKVVAFGGDVGSNFYSGETWELGLESPICDPDFNCDGNADQDDVGCVINVVAGNAGCECQDADFNRDGNVDQDDVVAVIGVVAGGPCP